MKKTLIAIAIAASLIACSKAGEAPKKSTANYIAKVNNVEITAKDVTEELKTLPPQVREVFSSKEGLEQFVDELIKKELLYQEAKKKGLDRSEKLRLKIEEFKKLMMIELLLEEAVEKKSEVSEKEARDFYEKNKKDFVLETKGKKEQIEFEKIKELLIQKLASEKQKDLFESYVDKLKNSNSIEINKEAIAAISNGQ